MLNETLIKLPHQNAYNSINVDRKVIGICTSNVIKLIQYLNNPTPRGSSVDYIRSSLVNEENDLFSGKCANCTIIFYMYK